MEGTIIENSLADKSVLTKLTITKTWNDEGWTLHDVVIDYSQIELIQRALDIGPWYVHFWKGDNIFVAYKDKLFHLKKSNPDSWREAIEYGRMLGIPGEQLDFVTE